MLFGGSVACFWRSRSALAFIGGGLLVLAGNFDRVERFTATFASSKIDAKLAVLNSTIDSANASLIQLRQLAVNTAKALIQLREGSNAILASGAGDQYQEEDAYKATLLNNLRNMGVSAAQLADVAHSDSKIVMTFYANAVYRFGRDTLPETQWGSFDRAYGRIVQPATPDEMEKLLAKFHIQPVGFSEYMEDYRYYTKTLEQRRPLVWAKRSTWGFGKQR